MNVKGSFTRPRLHQVVYHCVDGNGPSSMETGCLLAEWVRNPFCKKTARLHSHNDNSLTETETVRVNEP